MAGIVGYRGWSIDAEGRLEPPHWGDVESPWKPRGFAIARCEHRGHQPAERSCRCGLYAHYAITHAIKKEHPPILGAIVGWGSTVHHETGFRCGRARIIGLSLPRRKGGVGVERARQVADLYEIPFFEKTKDLRREAERWGETRRPDRIKKEDRDARLTGLEGSARAFGRLRSEQRGEPGLRLLPGVSPAGIRNNCVRLVVDFDLRPGALIEEEEDFKTMERVVRIEGIRGSYWDLLAVDIQTERIEVPLVGTTSQVAYKPGHQRILLKLIGDLPIERARQELHALERVGHITAYEEVPPEPIYVVPEFGEYPALPPRW